MNVDDEVVLLLRRAKDLKHKVIAEPTNQALRDELREVTAKLDVIVVDQDLDWWRDQFPPEEDST